MGERESERDVRLRRLSHVTTRMIKRIEINWIVIFSNRLKKRKTRTKKDKEK